MAGLPSRLSDPVLGGKRLLCGLAGRRVDGARLFLVMLHTRLFPQGQAVSLGDATGLLAQVMVGTDRPGERLRLWGRCLGVSLWVPVSASGCGRVGPPLRGQLPGLLSLR